MGRFNVLSLFCTIHLATAIVPSPIKGTLRGFNYDAADAFDDLFPAAKKLAIDGKPFTSARTYTALADENAAPDAVQPLPVFKAAVTSKTVLLIGVSCSKGNESFTKELHALEKVLQSNSKTAGGDINVFAANLVAGIVVGNEDLYRTSIQGTPAAEGQGKGDTVENINKYIGYVKTTLGWYGYKTKIPVGHADTWQMWTDKKYGLAVLPNIDFIGMQAFPYWQGYEIHNASAFKDEALKNVTENAGGVPVWVTETGWPTTGDPFHPVGSTDTKLQAVTGKDVAQNYWKEVGCNTLFKSADHPTWWFRLYETPAQLAASAGSDAAKNWGILDSVTGKGAAAVGKPAFPLACDVKPPTVPTATWGAAAATGAAAPRIKPRGLGSMTTTSEKRGKRRQARKFA